MDECWRISPVGPEVNNSLFDPFEEEYLMGFLGGGGGGGGP